MKISRVPEMRHMDGTAIEKYGLKDELLMENAGLAVFQVISDKLGVKGKRVAVFCGGGNNGGDGLVIARKIHSNGGWPTIFLLKKRDQFTGAARLNLEIVEKLRIELIDNIDLDHVTQTLLESDYIVDAIFGTGLDRDVGGIYRDVIETMNQSRPPVIAVDIPSGIHGETGRVMGIAVQAKYTVTFGLPKVGNLLYPGFEYGGELFTTHISFPPELYDREDLKIATNDPWRMPPRAAESHKGSVGKALFIAGSRRYLGAPYLAAMSFLKTGGGLSFLAAPDAVSTNMAVKGSEIILQPQQSTAEGSIAYENLDDLLEFAETVDFTAIGPGLSLAPETQRLVRDFVTQTNRPVLVDGDGLTALAHDLSGLKKRPAATVLTPHPGEMSRLCGKDIDTIEREKINILPETCAALNAIIVLKGAHSLIGCPDGRVFINLSGNPGMATAGSGDVLVGVIAAMTGRGFSPEQAARMGVFLHGLAGDLAAIELGMEGMVAGDILNHLPKALKHFCKAPDTVYENYYHSITVI